MECQDTKKFLSDQSIQHSPPPLLAQNLKNSHSLYGQTPLVAGAKHGSEFPTAQISTFHSLEKQEKNRCTLQFPSATRKDGTEAVGREGAA